MINHELLSSYSIKVFRSVKNMSTFLNVPAVTLYKLLAGKTKTAPSAKLMLNIAVIVGRCYPGGALQFLKDVLI